MEVKTNYGEVLVPSINKTGRVKVFYYDYIALQYSWDPYVINYLAFTRRRQYVELVKFSLPSYDFDTVTYGNINGTSWYADLSFKGSRGFVGLEPYYKWVEVAELSIDIFRNPHKYSFSFIED